jgi:hypothetical protein
LIFLGIDHTATFYLDYDFFDNFSLAQMCSLDTIGVDIEDMIREHSRGYLYYIQDQFEYVYMDDVRRAMHIWDSNERLFRNGLQRAISGLERDLFI